MKSDEYYMEKCIALAQRGMSHVAPNPMVGCVIVHKDRIIGEGYHMKYGEAHAEVNAINSVQDKALLSHSTLYVNLEPCSHFGKTPPCSNLIIENKIKRVVIGSNDPNPLVAGKGISLLLNAGIEVHTKVLKEQCDFLNRRFLKFHIKKAPYVILKWAESADGYIAPLDSKQVWLSGSESKTLSHQWRTEEQAILIGRKTAEIDNPQLTARLFVGKNPLRILINKENKLDRNLNAFNKESNTVVFNSTIDKNEKHLRFIKIDFNCSVVEQILNHLYAMKIISVIVEGGADTLKHFIDKNLWDEARIIKTEKVITSGIPAPELPYTTGKHIMVGNDKLEVVLNSHTWYS
jgi:diaminohydroxyphosphoribosylaminopyrimidine deaminase/5-amino-6-(5-phosphoribosylamino)uracil reductase